MIPCSVRNPRRLSLQAFKTRWLLRLDRFFRSRLGCISSRTDEETWHVHITLALTCELNSVYVAPGSDVSLTTGHMTKISAHSPTINDIRNGICAIEDLHNELFDPRDVVVLKVCPPISSERSPLNTTSDAESYPPY